MPLDAQSRELINVMQASSAPVESMSPQEARDASDARRAATPRVIEPVREVRDVVIETPAGGVGARVYRPSADAALPVVVFFHGGGWVMCDLESHDGLCRTLANGTGAVVVSVDYRRAPENPYPAAVADSYAATQWVAKHADELGVDAGRLAVAGDSAGGNLAAAVSLMARDLADPTIALQVLLYPVIEADFETPSYVQYGENFFLTREAMRWYWDQYVPQESRRDPYVAPIHAESLSGVAPAVVLVAECDPLHDEGLKYARRLADEGVETVEIDYLGGFHGFLSLGSVSPVAVRALGELAGVLRDRLAMVPASDR